MIDYKTNKVPASTKLSGGYDPVGVNLPVVSKGVPFRDTMRMDRLLSEFLTSKALDDGCGGGTGITTTPVPRRTGYDVKLIINTLPYEPDYTYPIAVPVSDRRFLGILTYMSDLQAALGTSRRVVLDFGSAKPSALLYMGGGFSSIALDNANTQGNKTVYDISAITNDKVFITFLLGSNPLERHDFTVGIQIDNIVHNIRHRAHASAISFSPIYTVEFRYDAESKVLHDLTR